MLISILTVLAGLALLIWSSDKFVDGAASIARIMGISPLIVGMFIVGLGTSAPEMLVAGVAALQGNPSLGIGNAIGSNITNITLVLGFTAVFFTLPVHSQLLRQELPLILASGILAWVLMMDGYFSRIDALILLTTLFIALGWMFYSVKKQAKRHDPLIDEAIEELPEKMPLRMATLWTIIGLVLLLISSKMLVWGASNIATQMGVSDLVIGLTIVAIGTSLPELAATLSSAKKGETDLAVGNIVGSNLFNTLAVLPIPGFIQPLVLPTDVLSRDLPIMLILTLILLLFSIGCFKHMRYKITRSKGFILLFAFIAYEGLIYYQISAT